MRRRTVRAARIAALLVLAHGPLTGCGIQETEVVEAGSPAFGDLLPPRETRLLLFFHAPDGDLLPVPRVVDVPWHSGGSPSDGEEEDPALSPRAAVTAQLAGPNKEERRAGLRNASSLPRAASAVGRVVTRGPTVEVGLNTDVRALTAPARAQLLCTAAYAAHPQGAPSVTLVGRDGRLPPADCPVRPVPAPPR
ncbi:hypothetical protein ACFV2V_00100 [Streptomyces sp. NPDC059698]|uniref:hypothetical protein n=1 Tax=unclassified Streptomyces TaxID=2593676 RepID=UPI00093C6E43|nr:hypothetical protein [Streptomyces sp. CB02366]OKJ32152.1 hypothetical protein AMK24_27515 [Streptomyces sp. CB02366]WSS59193.1 hypothetical protein OG543_29295 [Streptomyces sp. NBC_01178]